MFFLDGGSIAVSPESKLIDDDTDVILEGDGTANILNELRKLTSKSSRTMNDTLTVSILYLLYHVFTQMLHHAHLLD